MPFFLMGQSLGGALAILSALRLRNEKTMADVGKRFMGIMTNCPAIVGEPTVQYCAYSLRFLPFANGGQSLWRMTFHYLEVFCSHYGI